MKSIQFLLFVSFILFFSQLLVAQDDFYPETSTTTPEKIYKLHNDSNNIEANYQTAYDYEEYEEKYLEDDQKQQEEMYDTQNEERQRKERKRNVAVEVAADIFIEVALQTLFFVAWFYQ